MSKLLTLKQCSEEYGVSVSSIYREVSYGRLTLRKIGRASRILREDMEAWIEALPTGMGDKNHG